MLSLSKTSQLSSAAARFPTAPIVVGSIVGSYLIARTTRKRALGGVALAAGGAWCTWRWRETAGSGPAAGLLGIYLGAFGASHPLARRLGAWPSVLGVAGASGAATWALADRRR